MDWFLYDRDLCYERVKGHIETSPMVCRANKWTDFYMKGTSTVKELNQILDLNIYKKLIQGQKHWLALGRWQFLVRLEEMIKILVILSSLIHS